MSEINYSLIIKSNKNNLEEINNYLHENYLDDGDIDNLEVDLGENELIITFDSFGEFFEFAENFWNASESLKFDFVCTTMAGWNFDTDYFHFKLVHSPNNNYIFILYFLLPVHKKAVKIKFDEDSGSDIYRWNGTEYDDSDVPGVLFEDMIKRYYGHSCISQNLEVTKAEQLPSGLFLLHLNNGRGLLVDHVDFESDKSLFTFKGAHKTVISHFELPWRLPTIEELLWINENLHINKLGNFSDKEYWSTSYCAESFLLEGEENPYIFNFQEGKRYVSGVTGKNKLRLVLDIDLQTALSTSESELKKVKKTKRANKNPE